jgi:hypothetical protein
MRMLRADKACVYILDDTAKKENDSSYDCGDSCRPFATIGPHPAPGGVFGAHVNVLGIHTAGCHPGAI